MRWRVFAAALLVPTAAGAYVRTTTANTSCPAPARPLFWDRDNVTYVIDSAGSDNVPLASAVAAVRASFQTWEAVTCSFIAFEYGGTVDNPSLGNDEVNVVTWIESGWSHDANVLALTTTTFFCSGQMVDADIEVNGDSWQWTVGSQAGQYDIQNVMTHEDGHFIGFAHSPDTTSTMYFQSAAGDLSRRTLTADDAQGACDVYPEVVEPMPDAAPPPPTPDARPGTPDARPPPDAPPGTPDARPGTPDARPRPDARAGSPDAPPTSATAAEAACGCGVPGSGGGLLPLALVLWWMRLRTRAR